MRPEKEYLVAELREAISTSGFLILTSYQGLTVEQLADLRGRLSQADARLQVVKNRLVTRAAAEEGVGFNGGLTGPTAIVTGDGDVTEVARMLSDFAKDADLPKFKLGLVEGAVIGADDLQALASLPTRQVMLAQLLGLMQAPARNLAGVLYAKTASVVYALNAVLEKKENEG